MNVNKIKFWSFFWRYGIIILIPIEMILFILIPNIHPAWLNIIFSVNFITAGLDYIIASIYKMPHIYCVSQSIRHQLVTYDPYEMDWKNNFDKKQIIGIGVTFIIFGFTTNIQTIQHNSYKIQQNNCKHSFACV